MTSLPKSSTIAAAEAALRQYPYFTLPAILALKDPAVTPATPGAGALASRVAISLPDQQALAELLGPQAALFDNFYPEDTPVTPSTEDTIDTFLATFGKADPHEADALAKVIFNPTPDYAAVLAAEERANPTAPSSAPATDQDLKIATFLADNPATPGSPASVSAPSSSSGAASSSVSPTPSPRQHSGEASAEQSPNGPTPNSDILTNAPTATQKPAKDPDSAPLTESFVRILIKNRNYSKAIEIISSLNLKNPEKSAYFADQIRFLQKLIINENRK